MKILHVGRSWAGMGNPLEAKCPCPKESCGLVALDRAVSECTQHAIIWSKTMRQAHTEDACPGAPTQISSTHHIKEISTNTLTSARAALMSWDWKQQPDLADLAAILTDLTGGQIHLRQVTTGTDDYAVIIATEAISDDKASAMWLDQLHHGTDRWEL